MTVLLDKLFLEQTAEAAKMFVELIQTGKLTDSATKTSVTRSREANALVNVNLIPPKRIVLPDDNRLQWPIRNRKSTHQAQTIRAPICNADNKFY